MNRPRRILYLFACLVALTGANAASAQSELKINQLESAVRDLQRQVQSQAQRIDQLESRSSEVPRMRAPIVMPGAQSAPVHVDAAWLRSKNWDRVHPGMSELQVVEILGKPTQLRPTGENGRTLFYAMEIGTGAFLSGNVVIEQGLVTTVNRPALR